MSAKQENPGDINHKQFGGWEKVKRP